MKTLILILFTLFSAVSFAADRTEIQLDENLYSTDYKIKIVQQLNHDNTYTDENGTTKYQFFNTVTEEIRVLVEFNNFGYYVEDYRLYENNFASTDYTYGAQGIKYIPYDNSLTLYDVLANSGSYTFSLMQRNSANRWSTINTITLIASDTAIAKATSTFEEKRAAYEAMVYEKNVRKLLNVLRSLSIGLISLLACLFIGFKILKSLKNNIPKWHHYSSANIRQQKKSLEMRQIKRITEREMLKEIARTEVRNSSDEDLREMRQLIAESIRKGDSATATALTSVLEKMVDK
ncbi:TPA: hypothetical protein P0E26_005168 [Vibrio harveyi]|nr:hypothetical protein [Vibrio harveyi]